MGGWDGGWLGLRPGLWEGARKGWKGFAFCGCGVGWVAGTVLSFCGWAGWEVVLPPPVVLSSGSSPRLLR